MRKVRKVGVYLDYLHKGAVSTCIAVTLCGISYLTYRAYHYYAYIRPQFQIQKETENKKLLVEGSSETM